MFPTQQIALVGATLLAVPTGAAIQILPPRCTASVQVKYSSGGTLAIANQIGASTGNSYVLSTTEAVSMNGPASFFLAANGSTAVAAILFGLTAGWSAQP